MAILNPQIRFVSTECSSLSGIIPNKKSSYVARRKIRAVSQCLDNGTPKDAGTGTGTGTGAQGGLIQRHNISNMNMKVRRVAHQNQNQNQQSQQQEQEPRAQVPTCSSALAVWKWVQKACSCDVEFTQRFEKRGSTAAVISCPSAEFRNLCHEQLSLCSTILGSDTLFSLYIRPAGSYFFEQLELKLDLVYPGSESMEEDDTLVLMGTFGTQGSLRFTEAAFSETEAEDVPEYNAFVIPMIKDLFLVGILVAERLNLKSENIVRTSKGPDSTDSLQEAHKIRTSQLQTETEMLMTSFNKEQKTQAVKIARTLAVAYVMDQRALLLQQTFWQKGIRMNNLMEQMHLPLSTIRTLSKMLMRQLKRNEIPHDILDDILVQGDRMKVLLYELQGVFYQTKANLMHLWDGELNTVEKDDLKLIPRHRSTSPDYNEERKNNSFFLDSKSGADLELPMPPLALAPSQQYSIRPCNVSKLLSDLVDAGGALAQCQKQSLHLRKSSSSLLAAIDEGALRQALSNLLDSALLRVPAGGWVKVEAIEAPGGGVLVVINDNGPDMALVTQTPWVAPLGSELSNSRAEDNIAWNFVAGVIVAREILEQYGSVLQMLSPYLPNPLLGQGGTHVEIWLPPLPVQNTEQ